MATEVEIKLKLSIPIEAIREKLKGLGAKLIKSRHFEDNILFDTEGYHLRSKGQLLRVRNIGSGGKITFKGAQESSTKHKVRFEIESPVEDPAAIVSIFEKIGLRRTFRYQKYRESFHLQSCTVELDETPIGNYIEIEGPPDAIDQLALVLGYSEADYIVASYAGLFYRECRESGRNPATGMVFKKSPEVSP
ncbi:class IV adenylate cyclase [Acidobacteriota bacterium]